MNNTNAIEGKNNIDKKDIVLKNDKSEKNNNLNENENKDRKYNNKSQTLRDIFNKHVDNDDIECNVKKTSLYDFDENKESVDNIGNNSDKHIEQKKKNDNIGNSTKSIKSKKGKRHNKGIVVNLSRKNSKESNKVIDDDFFIPRTEGNGMNYCMDVGGIKILKQNNTSSGCVCYETNKNKTVTIEFMLQFKRQKQGNTGRYKNYKMTFERDRRGELKVTMHDVENNANIDVKILDNKKVKDNIKKCFNNIIKKFAKDKNLPLQSNKEYDDLKNSILSMVENNFTVYNVTKIVPLALDYTNIVPEPFLEYHRVTSKHGNNIKKDGNGGNKSKLEKIENNIIYEEKKEKSVNNIDINNKNNINNNNKNNLDHNNKNSLDLNNKNNLDHNSINSISKKEEENLNINNNSFDNDNNLNENKNKDSKYNNNNQTLKGIFGGDVDDEIKFDVKNAIKFDVKNSRIDDSDKNKESINNIIKNEENEYQNKSKNNLGDINNIDQNINKNDINHKDIDFDKKEEKVEEISKSDENSKFIENEENKSNNEISNNENNISENKGNKNININEYNINTKINKINDNFDNNINLNINDIDPNNNNNLNINQNEENKSNLDINTNKINQNINDIKIDEKDKNNKDINLINQNVEIGKTEDKKNSTILPRNGLVSNGSKEPQSRGFCSMFNWCNCGDRIEEGNIDLNMNNNTATINGDIGQQIKK